MKPSPFRETVKDLEIDLLEPEDGDEVSYLESMTTNRGGGDIEESQESEIIDFDKIGEMIGENPKTEKAGRYVTVGDEIRQTATCGKNALKLRGLKTGAAYYRFMFCYRWLCQKCGAKGGRIHKKRLYRILNKISRYYSGYLEEQKDMGRDPDETLNLRQFVFTVPMELRKYFETRKDIQALNGMVERLIKRVFTQARGLRYFHGFGDKDKSIYNPHVNIHLFEFRPGVLALPAETLQDIRYRYANALKGYLLQVHGIKLPDSIFEKLDVHYSFIEGQREYDRYTYDAETKQRKPVKISGKALVIHRVKYMSRPCPGPENFEHIKDNKKLLRLFVLKMKGFHYISNLGRWGINDEQDDMKEAETLAGERLQAEKDAQGKVVVITRAEFNLQFIEKDYVELSEGFYRIKKKKT